MCLLAALSHVPLSEAEFHKLTAKLASLMGKTQGDGFGFAVSSTANSACDKHIGHYVSASAYLHQRVEAETSAILPIETTHEIEGSYPKTPSGAVWHARTATCAQGLRGCHPHTEGSVVLAHNGVVSVPKGSSIAVDWRECDSLAIARSLSKAGSPLKLAEDVTGWLAIVWLDGQGFLNVLRDDTTPLYCLAMPTVGKSAAAFGTKPEIVMAIAKAVLDRADYRRAAPYSLKPYMWCRYNGSLWEQQTVPAWQRTSTLSWGAQVALGKTNRSLFRYEERETGEYSKVKQGEEGPYL